MNHTITHPGQMQMQAQVILASKTDTGAPPIYTIRMRYPRIIHAEGKTHRIIPFRSAVAEAITDDYSVMDDINLGRNAGSSRARPARVTIQEVRDNPFVPWHWGKNQSGMQANEENDAKVLVDWDHEIGHEEWVDRGEAWLESCAHATRIAEGLANAGYHKQIFNRLLEPFSWIDVLATGTEWENFLWLRDHEDAEPHIRDLARIVRKAIDGAHVQHLKPGEWHLPYITDVDVEEVIRSTACGLDETTEVIEGIQTQMLQRISAARCARISYRPFDSDTASIEKDLALYDKLMATSSEARMESIRVHASPLEHQATPDNVVEYYHCPVAEDGTADYGNAELRSDWEKPHLHGNLTSWIQHRKTISGENYTGDTKVDAVTAA